MIQGVDLPILCYHSIDDTGSLISITPTLFKKQLEYLKKNQYRVISLDDMLGLLVKGKLPLKTIVITFDDGYKNNYTVAFPLLKSFGFSATVFLVTGYVGQNAGWIKRDFEELSIDKKDLSSDRIATAFFDLALLKKRIPYLLTLPRKHLAVEIKNLLKVSELPILAWNEVQEMSKGGIEFGPHSHTHPFLTELPLENVAYEIQRSKEAIEENIKEKVNFFCYPYGAVNDGVATLLKDYRFLGICTTRFGINNTKDLNLFALKRIPINNSIDSLKFSLCLSKFNKYIFRAKRVLTKTVKYSLIRH